MLIQVKYSRIWIASAYFFAPIFGFATALIPFYGIDGLVMTAVYGGLPLAYLSTVIFALPLFTLFKRMNYFLAQNFAFGGVLCALPVALLFITFSLRKWYIFPNAVNIITADLIFFFHLLGIGLCSGLWFWAIGIWLPNQKFKRISGAV